VTEASDVLAVLERFRTGWERLDADAVLDCFARDPQIVVIGTDQEEWWRGYEALVEPFRVMVDTFSNLEYRWTTPPHIVVNGAVAWADAVLDTRLIDAGRHRLVVTMRTSWVLRLATRWEVVQAHFSVAPTAPVAAY